MARLADLFVSIRADDKPAQAVLRGVTASLGKIDRQRVEPRVSLPAKVATDLAGLQNQLQALSRQRVSLNVNSTTARADVEVLRRQLDQLQTRRHTVPVALAGEVDKQIANVQRDLQAAERRQTKIPLTLERVDAKFAAVHEQVLKLEREGVDLPVEVDESKAVASGRSAGGKFGSSFASVARHAVATAGIYVGLEQVVGFLGDANAEAIESQKVGATTAQIIRSTGGAAKVSAQQIGDLATSISNKTGMDDEAIQSGANLLLTFKNVRNEVGAGSNVFDRATQSAVDLSAAGFGSVGSASKMLGKALNDPVKGISALSRAGVTFTDQQKDQIKTLVSSGRTLDAQKIILGEVESQVGGVAGASATMGEKLTTAFNNFKEQIGTAMLPVIERVQTVLVEKVIPAVSGFITQMQSGEGAGGQFASVMGKIWTVVSATFGFIADHRDLFGALAAGILTAVAGMKAFSVVMAVVNAVMSANPIGLVVLAIAGLVAGLIYAYKHSETFRDIVTGVWSAVKTAVTDAWEKGIKPAVEAIANFFTKTLPAAFSKVGDGISTAVDGIKTGLNGAKDWVVNTFAKAWGAVKDTIVKPVTDAAGAVAGALGAGANGIQDGFNAATSWVSGIWSKGWTATKGFITGPVADGAKSVGSTLADGKNGLQSAFSSATSWVKDQWSKEWDGIKTVIHSPAEAGKNLINNTLNSDQKASLVSAFNKTSTWVKNTWSTAWNKSKDILAKPIANAAAAIGVDMGGEKGVRKKLDDARAWVESKFKRAWSVIQGFLKDPIGSAKNAISTLLDDKSGIRSKLSSIGRWIVGTFKGKWDDVKGFFTDPIGSAKRAIDTLLHGKGGMVSLFQTAVSGVGRAMDKIKKAAGTPVNFVIGTVYNNGIRKALNLIPGVNFARASTIKFASGGVMPGFTPGRDVHQFVSPTAGRLALSGGEAIMRPEFTRAVGGASGVDRLNKAARSGDLFKSGRSAKPTDDELVPPTPQQVSSINVNIPGLPTNLAKVAKAGPKGTGGWGALVGNDGGGTRNGAVTRGESMIGQMGWYRRCLAFVNAAWNYSVGRFRLATARQSMNAGPRTMTGTPPPGAGVYWDTGPSGHIALAVGDGTVISNDIVQAGRLDRVPQSRLNRWGPYRGWWSPNGAKGGAGDPSGGGVFGPILDWASSQTSKLLGAVKGRIGDIGGPWGPVVRKAANYARGKAWDYAKSAPAALWNTISEKVGDVVTTGSNRVRGLALLTKAGFNPLTQWGPLNKLWTKESGWRTNAENPSSGAYGIPQALPGSKMASVGGDWRTNPNTQIRWGLQYIKERYGKPSAAWAHSQATNWYDTGGILRPGVTMAVNGTGKPETVRTFEQERLVQSRLSGDYRRAGSGDDKLDRLIALIEERGLNAPIFNFGDTINPQAETLSQSTNRTLQRVANLGLIG